MRILVLSDSHAGMHFMRTLLRTVKPQAVIHLGDYYEDGQTLAEENPQIFFHLLPGNCDRYRCPPFAKAVLCYDVGGVRLFMAHGHQHFVKSGTGALIRDARDSGAAAALYGHTHIADCRLLEDGLWVLNPGSCGSSGGSAGLIDTENGKITGCRIIRQEDLEEIV